MNKANKLIVDTLLTLLKEYADGVSIICGVFEKAIDAARDVSASAFGHDGKWTDIIGFSRAIVYYNPRMTNQEFYTAFRLIGIEVDETE